MVGGDDYRADAGRSAAADFRHPAIGAVCVQGGQDHLPVPPCDGVNLKDAFAAALAGLALSHTIAKAVLYGFFTTSIPFFRTPKNADNHGFWVAISEAREEVFIMLLLWGAALGILVVHGLPSNDMRFWVVMLLVQSLPYLAALVMAFTSSLPKPAQVLEQQPTA